MVRIRHLRAAKSRRGRDHQLLYEGRETPYAEVPEGYARCGVCERVARVTPTGHLHRHEGAGGVECPNTTLHRDDVDYDADLVEELRQVDRDARLASPTRTCQECGKPVTGERKFCGQCLRRRG